MAAQTSGLPAVLSEFPGNDATTGRWQTVFESTDVEMTAVPGTTDQVDLTLRPLGPLNLLRERPPRLGIAHPDEAVGLHRRARRCGLPRLHRRADVRVRDLGGRARADQPGPGRSTGTRHP